MSKAIVPLAGAAMLALVALAPQTASARHGPDWGVTLNPGGIYIGPKYEYPYHHRYRRFNEYSYGDRDRDYADWRYRHRDRWFD